MWKGFFFIVFLEKIYIVIFLKFDYEYKGCLMWEIQKF